MNALHFALNAVIFSGFQSLCNELFTFVNTVWGQSTMNELHFFRGLAVKQCCEVIGYNNSPLTATVTLILTCHHRITPIKKENVCRKFTYILIWMLNYLHWNKYSFRILSTKLLYIILSRAVQLFITYFQVVPQFIPSWNSIRRKLWLQILIIFFLSKFAADFSWSNVELTTNAKEKHVESV